MDENNFAKYLSILIENYKLRLDLAKMASPHLKNFVSKYLE